MVLRELLVTGDAARMQEQETEDVVLRVILATYLRGAKQSSKLALQFSPPLI